MILMIGNKMVNTVKGCTQMEILQVGIPGEGNIAVCCCVAVLQRTAEKTEPGLSFH